MLSKICIGHDNSGFGPGWFLDKVVVSELDAGNNEHQEWFFLCGKWFDKTEEDGKRAMFDFPQSSILVVVTSDMKDKSSGKLLYRTSMALRMLHCSHIVFSSLQEISGVQALVGNVKVVDFGVLCFTTADANVHIVLYGDKGSSGKRKLEVGNVCCGFETSFLSVLQGKGNLFENGRTDEFGFQCIDLGIIQKIQIGHDNSGFGPGWSACID